MTDKSDMQGKHDPIDGHCEEACSCLIDGGQDIEDGDFIEGVDGCLHGVPWCERCPECEESDEDED